MVAHCAIGFKHGIRCIVPYCLPSRAATCKGTLNFVKVQYKLRAAFGQNLPFALVWKYGMEYGRKF